MEQDLQITEEFIMNKFKNDAERFEKRYGDYIEEAAKTYDETYKSHGKTWGLHDTVALGQYMEQWETYCQIAEADVTTRDQLGDYMKVGLGLAAIQYITLPASFLASVQPLADEVGLIYYRELVATATRGDITAGDIIGKKGGKLSNELDTYYSEQLTSTTALVATTDHYDITLSSPVRARTISVVITIDDGANAGTYRGLDDGDGYIIGNWPTPADLNTGDVNYDTGDSNIEVEIADATSGSIVITYHQNLAQATTIPGFLYRLTSKAVRANYFVLENEYSTLADYSVRRRFGEAVSDDVASAAVGQINSAVLTAIIKKLKLAANTTGTTNWDATLPAGVSTAEHRRTFSDAIEEAVQKIDAETGRGALSFIVAGSYTRRILQSIGVEMNRKPIPGPYLIGFYQNVPVFYAPKALVADDECVVGYRGSSWFEAPVVYAPYLPIVVVKGIGRNVFNRVTGVAHAAAVDTVVEGFTSMIKITNM